MNQDGTWDFKLPEPDMTVLASVRRHRRLDVAVCRGDRSRRITFGPFD